MLDDFSETLYELCKWDSSLTENEYINNLKFKCKLIYIMANHFRDKYDELNEYVHNKFSYKEECIHSKALSRGFYHPNPITEVIIGGCKRGKLSKRAIKPCFEYWFDNNKRLIHSIQFDYYSLENDNFSGDKKVASNEFILHYKEYQVGLLFNEKDLIEIEICKYNDGKILCRINTDSGLSIDFKSVNSIRFEKFDYNESDLFKYYEYNYSKIAKGFSDNFIDEWNFSGYDSKCLEYLKNKRDYIFSHNEVTFCIDKKTSKILSYIYNEFLDDEIISREEYKIYTDVDV